MRKPRGCTCTRPQSRSKRWIIQSQRQHMKHQTSTRRKLAVRCQHVCALLPCHARQTHVTDQKLRVTMSHASVCAQAAPREGAEKQPTTATTCRVILMHMLEPAPTQQATTSALPQSNKQPNGVCPPTLTAPHHLLIGHSMLLTPVNPHLPPPPKHTQANTHFTHSQRQSSHTQAGCAKPRPPQLVCRVCVCECGGAPVELIVLQRVAAQQGSGLGHADAKAASIVVVPV